MRIASVVQAGWTYKPSKWNIVGWNWEQTKVHCEVPVLGRMAGLEQQTLLYQNISRKRRRLDEPGAKSESIRRQLTGVAEYSDPSRSAKSGSG